MLNFVLIIIFTASNTSHIEQVQFESLNACKVAERKVLELDKSDWGHLSTSCVSRK